MAVRRNPKLGGKSAGRFPANARRERATFRDALAGADRRARETANRRSGKRCMKSVWAAVAEPADELMDFDAGFFRRSLRWLAALALLPVCWITAWTLLSRFSDAAQHGGFWKSQPFWYFIVGALVMGGWFISGLGQRFFLYLYVLGHELTHVFFVTCSGGRVTDFHVSADGGFITTNKSNLLIALSPYFVPFWSVIAGLGYVAIALALKFPPGSLLWFYGAMGVTWTFHMVWTLWMLPRDQPDLRENGTFFSLAVIFLANVLILAAIFCVADGDPLENAAAFAREWLRHAVTWTDAAFRWGAEIFAAFRAEAKL